MPAVLFDALVLPDGEVAVQALSKDGHALAFIRDQFRHCKPILILGASIALLDAIGVPTTDAPGLVCATCETEAAVARFMKLVEKHRAFERETDPPAV
jgi:catalase